jgi:hypothetical protein
MLEPAARIGSGNESDGAGRCLGQCSAGACFDANRFWIRGTLDPHDCFESGAGQRPQYRHVLPKIPGRGIVHSLAWRVFFPRQAQCFANPAQPGHTDVKAHRVAQPFRPFRQRPVGWLLQPFLQPQPRCRVNSRARTTGNPLNTVSFSSRHKTEYFVFYSRQQTAPSNPTRQNS